MQNNARKTDLEKFTYRSRLLCSAYFNRLVGHNIILQCMGEIIIQCVNQLDNVS